MTIEELEQIDTLIARRLAASAPPAARTIEGRTVRPHATVQDGMVYMLPKRGRTLDRLMAVGLLFRIPHHADVEVELMDFFFRQVVDRWLNVLYSPSLLR